MVIISANQETWCCIISQSEDVMLHYQPIRRQNDRLLANHSWDKSYLRFINVSALDWPGVACDWSFIDLLSIRHFYQIQPFVTRHRYQLSSPVVNYSIRVLPARRSFSFHQINWNKSYNQMVTLWLKWEYCMPRSKCSSLLQIFAVLRARNKQFRSSRSAEKISTNQKFGEEKKFNNKPARSQWDLEVPVCTLEEF